jgi:hypothetical protein
LNNLPVLLTLPALDGVTWRHDAACRATVLSLPDIMVFDDGTMVTYHKPIAKVKHQNVGHKQHARLYGSQASEI